MIMMAGLIKSIYAVIVKLSFRRRVFLLNLRDAIKVDNECVIHSGAVIKIWKGGTIKIGSATEVMHGVVILTYGGNVTIGNNCSINPYAILYGHGDLIIGNNVLIAGGSMLIPNNHVFKDRQQPIVSQGSTCIGIKIEDDVWIGHACSILDGVTIGRGSIVGAGSVVNKDVPPYSVVAGVPAAILKERGVND